MAIKDDNFSVSEHRWHSDEYVEEWIERDIQRDDERRPRLQRMLSLANFPGDSAIVVIDIGGGYGVVSEEILKAWPHARVTLQDFSAPMLARARQRLAKYLGQVEFLRSDLRDQSWSEPMRETFDLVVSAIAIHNLYDARLIEHCYGGIFRLLKPSGLFLD
ncbi:MAG: class I SAM-dependent methyltransferase, partial [Candidatus Binataceae bacterium]